MSELIIQIIAPGAIIIGLSILGSFLSSSTITRMALLSLLLGSLLNLSAMLFNNGKMPVLALHKKSQEHLLARCYLHKPLTRETRFKFLADIFSTPLGSFSIGDFFFCAGIIGLILGII